eukprot:5153602-Pyramimonas_sp.AAC.2
MAFVRVKCDLEGDIRRFSLEEPLVFDELKKHLETIYVKGELSGLQLCRNVRVRMYIIPASLIPSGLNKNSPTSDGAAGNTFCAGPGRGQDLREGLFLAVQAVREGGPEE